MFRSLLVLTLSLPGPRVHAENGELEPRVSLPVVPPGGVVGVPPCEVIPRHAHPRPLSWSLAERPRQHGFDSDGFDSDVPVGFEVCPPEARLVRECSVREESLRPPSLLIPITSSECPKPSWLQWFAEGLTKLVESRWAHGNGFMQGKDTMEGPGKGCPGQGPGRFQAWGFRLPPLGQSHTQ